MIDEPILITGAPRSGTSLTAAMIYYGGAFGGNMALPDKKKSGAMSENLEIQRLLLKPYLKSLGYDPMGQNPVPDLDCTLTKAKIKEDAFGWYIAVRKTIENQGYNGKGFWFYKDPKICLIWPLWHLAFPKAHWIIVHRDIEQVISSCLSTSFLTAYNDREGWRGWITHHENMFKQMEDAGLNIIHAYPDKMIKGDFSEIEGIINSLCLTWDSARAQSLINHNFWRAK